MRYQLKRFIGIIKFKIARVIYRKKQKNNATFLCKAMPYSHFHFLKKALKKHGLKTTRSRLSHLKIIANENQNTVLSCAIQNYEKRTSLISLSWNDFKLLSELNGLLEDHESYEFCLTQYDPTLELINTSQSTMSNFTSYGLGEETLNTYRHIECNDTSYFEKIYLSESKDLLHLLWFFKHAQSAIIQSGFKVPRILKVNQGKKLTAVYFEFYSQKLDNLNCFLDSALNIALRINKIELSDSAILESSKLQFEKLPIYQDNYLLLQKILAHNGIENIQLAAMQNRVNAFPRVLSHGDLHGKNLGQPNIIIDWDKSGLYPIGFDIAYILSNCYIFLSIDDFINFVKQQLSKNDSIKQETEILFSIAFFAMIFYSRKLGKKILPNGLLSIYTYLLDHLYQGPDKLPSNQNRLN